MYNRKAKIIYYYYETIFMYCSIKLLGNTNPLLTKSYRFMNININLFYILMSTG